MSDLGIAEGENLYNAVELDQIMVADHPVSLLSLFKRYENHEFGVFHADQPLRYSQKYAYDRQQMLVDLGDDVHPVRHGQHTDRVIVVPIIKEQIKAGQIDGLSPHEIGVLRVAAITHDFGECEHPNLGETIGDVPYFEKTTEHELQEVGIRERVMTTVYPDLPADFLLEVEDIVANKSGTPARELFNASEHIGYFLTMSGAGRLALALYRKGDMSQRAIQLARMANDGARFWHNDLLSLADKFAYPGQMAQDTEALIDSIDQELPHFLERALNAS